MYVARFFELRLIIIFSNTNGWLSCQTGVYVTHPSNHVPHNSGHGVPLNEVKLQFLDIMTVLADSLFDPSLLAGLNGNPYVLSPTARFDKASGARLLQFLSDGDWWTETSKQINAGCVGRTKKVFPIIIYMDETHVTGDGKFKATPVFCQAANLSEEVRSRTDSWRFLGFIPQLNTPGSKFTEAQVWGVLAALY
jgi:hypothetical protein